MRNYFENRYQFVLVALSTLVILLLGLFFYRELFPEYKIYQQTYVELEKIRSEISGEAVPEYKYGIKQVLIPNDHNGPEEVDRCMSCHTAIDLPHFAPKIPERDINGQIIRDANGKPILVDNPDYIWGLEDKLAEPFRNPKELMHESFQKVAHQKELLERFGNLRMQKIDAWSEEMHVDMAKVLIAHPLIGNETEPFSLHPIEEYGCTSCHSGNGRSLVAKRAHGPYYDNEIKHSNTPSFTDIDEENDPRFSKMFNERPGHELLFQTTPLLVGGTIESRCVQCHETGRAQILGISEDLAKVGETQEKALSQLQESITNDQKALVQLLALRGHLQKNGLKNTLEFLSKELENFSLSDATLDARYQNFYFLSSFKDDESAQKALEQKMAHILGGQEEIQVFLSFFENGGSSSSEESLVQSYVDTNLRKGPLYDKRAELEKASLNLAKFENARVPVELLAEQKESYEAVQPSLSNALKEFERGQFLFFNNACYTCHKVEGMSRGGVGPELTEAGLSYPWFLKESIVWPRADLKSSVMPNFRLDHGDVEGLMTFLLSLRGGKPSVSEMEKVSQLKGWEGGKKLDWEKPITPDSMYDLDYAMEVYATEGCASCHRLEGFSSQMGFAVGQEEKLSNWFKKLFPEQIMGRDIINQIDKHRKEIEKNISFKGRSKGILDKLSEKYPELIEGYYTPFKFALRSKDALYESKIELAQSQEERDSLLKEWDLWKKTVSKVLMVYIQEYGFGRLIAPKLSFSGVYRDTAWLMGHFFNPAEFTPRSFMPTFPYDETKFYALTYMLQSLGKKNQIQLHQEFSSSGFNPESVYQELCSSCHGEHLSGNGPISEMLYPIPKNLRNPVFMSSLGKDHALKSILEGVAGTSMPAWGETGSEGRAVLSKYEAQLLVDWLYVDVPERAGDDESHPKWKYMPEDIVRSLQKTLEPLEPKVSSATVGSYFTKEIKDGAESFMIRPEFYTPENIQAGEQNFLMNCAHCHGRDADGSGERSVTMEDAKPRVLTNLPWLRSRDDLRLLRSIKFGVPGTSMTPWGDKTSITQRMQLVLFIRSLSEIKEQQKCLTDVLFSNFGSSEILVNQARSADYKSLSKTKATLFETQVALEEAKASLGAEKDAVTLFEKSLFLERELKSQERKDQHYLSLIEVLKKEAETYEDLGQNIIESFARAELLEDFLALIQADGQRLYQSGKGLKLSSRKDSLKEKQNALLDKLQKIVDELSNSLEHEKGKFFSEEQKSKLSDLSHKRDTMLNLYTEMGRGFEYIDSLYAKQSALVHQILNAGVVK